MLKTRVGINTGLLLLAIVLWLVIAGFGWSYRQTDQSAAKLADEVVDQRRVLRRLEQSGDIASLQQQLAALEKELASEKVSFPRGDVSLSLADLIVQAAARSGVDLIGAMEAARDNVVIGASKYQALRYQIDVDGTIAQFQDFLGWMEATPRDESSGFYRLRTLKVDKLKLANKGGGRWNYNFDLAVYTQL